MSRPRAQIFLLRRRDDKLLFTFDGRAKRYPKTCRRTSAAFRPFRSESHLRCPLDRVVRADVGRRRASAEKIAIFLGAGEGEPLANFRLGSKRQLLWRIPFAINRWLGRVQVQVFCARDGHRFSRAGTRFIGGNGELHASAAPGLDEG